MAKKEVTAGDWKRFLLTRKTDDGKVNRAVGGNVTTILVHDPAWAGVLAYDEFAETIVTRKVPPWRPQDAPPGCRAGDWTDEDTLRVQNWMADAYGMDVGEKATLGGVKLAARRAPFHPVREWLEGLHWDGKRRVRSWLHDIMGCTDDAYTREVGLSFLVSAVARVMAPGCKVDTAPILEGEQGTFKSSVIRALAGDEWFLEMSITDVSSKDAMQVLKRKWIAELPEIDGLARSEWAHVKAYFSRQVDTYRPSYGVGSRDFPRQTVFCGSTNRSDYLGDETGARRFHPVRCRMGNVALARELREQLWAEAVALYQSGVAWHVTDPELATAFVTEQDARFRVHPWEETIAAWLERPIDLPMGKKRAEIGVTTADVLEGALKIETGKRTQSDANAVGAVLRRLGWRQGPQSRRNGVAVRLFFPAEARVEETVSGVHEIACEDRGDVATDEDWAALRAE